MNFVLIAISLFAPAILLVFSVLNLSVSGTRPWTTRLIQPMTIGLIISALLVVGLFGMQSLGILEGSQTFTLSGWVRLDVISVSLFVLICFLASILLMFSRNYLDGESRQGYFLGWLGLAIISVLGLVLTDSLVIFGICWMVSSLCLNRLLLFYPNRRVAIRAAKKEFLFARLSDLVLFVALVLLWRTFDTLSITEQAQSVQAMEDGSGLFWAAGLLAVSAVLKSAQFPAHGWVTEVMEAPTPVSALLHAGIINAGGLALIRFSDVIVSSPAVLAFLVLIGGFTALFASLVMLTQSAVKTSLGWSTIAQMGFMILQCGLTLFPLAFLHILLHSLYKAHAFLSSGGAVKTVALVKQPGPIAIPNSQAVTISFGIGISLYIAMNLIVGLEGKSAQALAMGTILILGVSYLLAQGLAGGAPRQLMIMTAVYATMASFAYIVFHKLADKMTEGLVPPVMVPGPLEWALIFLTLASFAITAFAQSTFPMWAHHPAVRGMRIHLINGLYVNALLDRVIGKRRPTVS